MADTKTTDTDRFVREATRAMQAGDFATANAIAQQGIDAGVEHPFLFKVQAFWSHNTGDFRQALRQFHHARTLDPQDPSILNGLASCLTALGQFAAALEIVDIAIAAVPNAAPNYFLRGWILEQAGDFSEAKAAYEAALKLTPKDANLLAALAAAAFQLEEFETARKKAEEALALSPGQFTAIKTLAAVDIATGVPKAAETRLKAALQSGLAPNIRSQFLSILGNALDAQGETTKAFSTWQQKVKEAHRHAAPPSDPLMQFLQQFEATDAKAWQSEPADGKTAPIFICGPGNDLLQRTLAVSCRLNGSLNALASEHLADPAAFESLAALKGEDLEELRSSYWQKLSVPADQKPVECNARHPLDLPLIAKLFPNAKVVVVIRDPRDAVLDAFRHQTGAETGSIFPLEDCAEAYVTALSFAAACKARLPLQILEVKLEDMASDFAGVAQRVGAFLGIETQPIAVPARLAQATGVWRRYKEEMALTLAILAPQVKALDYSAD